MIDILSETRIGHGSQGTHELPAAVGFRSAFDADIDRITFCDAFRRLQDKTQVHGPAGNDYVRSRLTHSMEVSRLGRQIGEIFGNLVLQRAPELAPGRQPYDFATATAAACLMHDIGNPCFGHTGEKSISESFQSTDTGREIIRRLGDHPLAGEAQTFEGNAQGLREVARLQGWRAGSGLRLTAAVLAGFCKYPFERQSARSDLKKGKYGYFASEAETFHEVAAATGMRAHPDGGYYRHPLAYLVEAADDTCYRIVDLEDAYVMGCLSFDEAESLLLEVAGDPGDGYGDIATPVRKLTRLRSLAISKLVVELAQTMARDFDAIVTGGHAGDLVLMGESAAALGRIEKISRARIYNGPERVRTDLLAHKTISALLDTYLTAFMERENGRQSAWSKSILKSFPHADRVGHDAASYVRAALDYVAGMTDDFALRQARLFPAPQRRAA